MYCTSNMKNYFMAGAIFAIPALRQDHQLKASLSYKARPYLKRDRRKGKRTLCGITEEIKPSAFLPPWSLRFYWRNKTWEKMETATMRWARSRLKEHTVLERLCTHLALGSPL